LLEDRVGVGTPTVLEVSMAGVSYGVASGQGECAFIIREVFGVGKLLEEDSHKPFGVAGRAGAGFMIADRVRDMVLEVGARNVHAIPALREHDLDANPVTLTLGEFERLRIVSVVVEAMVVECFVVCRVRHGLGSGTSDHSEALRKLHTRLIATMQVVDSPSRRHELVLAGVLMLVVERWSPVVGFVFLDLDTRARAFAEVIVIVSSSKVATADYVVNMLARVGLIPVRA